MTEKRIKYWCGEHDIETEYHIADYPPMLCPKCIKEELEAELEKARDAISAIRIALLEPKLSDGEKLSSIKVSIKSLDWN